MLTKHSRALGGQTLRRPLFVPRWTRLLQAVLVLLAANGASAARQIRPERQASRFALVVAPVGDASRHATWLEASESRSRGRTWDLAALYYGQHPTTFACDECVAVQHLAGAKWRLVSAFINSSAWPGLAERYDVVMVADDDLHLLSAALDRFFEVFRAYTLALAQPAVCPGSYSAWHAQIVGQRAGSLLRFTNFVEAMAPAFEMRFFESIVRETLTEAYTAWGLDMVWPFLLGFPRDKVAIVDEVCMGHAQRAARSTSVYASDMPRNEYEEKDYFLLKYDYKQENLDPHGLKFWTPVEFATVPAGTPLPERHPAAAPEQGPEHGQPLNLQSSSTAQLQLDFMIGAVAAAATLLLLHYVQRRRAARRAGQHFAASLSPVKLRRWRPGGGPAGGPAAKVPLTATCSILHLTLRFPRRKALPALSYLALDYFNLDDGAPPLADPYALMLQPRRRRPLHWFTCFAAGLLIGRWMSALQLLSPVVDLCTDQELPHVELRDNPTTFSVYDSVTSNATTVFLVTCNLRLRSFAASPSVSLLESGRLLVVMEQEVQPWESGVKQPEVKQVKQVHASDDGGASWRQVATVAGMHWPRLFKAASGTYVMGVARAGPSPGNPVVVSRMLDAHGERWSVPVAVTPALGAVSSNAAVDVSFGRVTAAIEINPSMASPINTAITTDAVLLRARGGMHGAAWVYPPVLDMPVDTVDGFVESAVVQVRLHALPKPLFFRALSVLPGQRVLRLRLERYTLHWLHQDVVLPAGTRLIAGAGRQQYVALDWVAVAISADERQDLTLPESWTLVERGVGNPAALHTEAMLALFALGGDATRTARRLALGFDTHVWRRMDRAGQDSVGAAWAAGLGPLYFMEGSVVRLQDRHGGSGRLLSIMRVNNALLCDLSALVEYDDVSTPGKLTGRFLRYASIPGLSVAHPALLYDAPSDLYWMVSNINRDALRRWNTTGGRIRYNEYTACETDRSTLALYYSPSAVTWHFATVIDFHLRLDRGHFTYPHALVNGSDLLIVSRATLPDAAGETEPCYNNHNSQQITFHRVRGFRAYANTDWALYQGSESEWPRRTAMRDEYLPTAPAAVPPPKPRLDCVSAAQDSDSA